MAFSCYRIFRSVRSVCLPVTTVVGFSFLLTWIFILYQPTPGPGIIQRMGWQSWDSIDDKPPNVDASTGNSNTGGSNTGGTDVDWWNVTTTEDNVDYAGLPLDVWNPLLPHITGCQLQIPPCNNIADSYSVSIRTSSHTLRDGSRFGRGPLPAGYNKRARRNKGEMGPC